ncbi:hypothetical protein ScPMuIL_018296 [Solemya velum]
MIFIAGESSFNPWREKCSGHCTSAPPVRDDECTSSELQLAWKKGQSEFGTLRLASALFKCVQCNKHTKDATRSDVEKVIKEWLRTAKDRDGGRKQRGKQNFAVALVDGRNSGPESDYQDLVCVARMKDTGMLISRCQAAMTD